MPEGMVEQCKIRQVINIIVFQNCNIHIYQYINLYFNMEESKEIQGIYSVFRIAIYVSLVLEFFEYTIGPDLLGVFPGVIADIHERIGRWTIYQLGHLPYSKIATLMLVIITCIGTKNKKQIEFDARKMVFWPLVFGIALVLLSVWFYYTDLITQGIWVFKITIWLYMICSTVGIIAVHVALDNVSKYLKDGMSKDRFNFENESFEQNEKHKETKYSVNIPMRYYHKGKFRKGWINLNNPFRGTFVIGTPGSGKSFSIIEPFIRQHTAKGFSMMVYDYKFPTLAQKLYYHYRINKKAGLTPKGCSFNVINFVDVEYSRRINPIQHKYINDLAAAQETATTLVESLQGGKKEGGGGSDDFFFKSAVNFLASIIYFFVNYKKEPYKAKGVPLYAEYIEDPETHHQKLTGRVFDTAAHRDAAVAATKKGREEAKKAKERALKNGKTEEEAQRIADAELKKYEYNEGLTEPAFWLGKYSDMPHVLSFLNHDYNDMFEVLKTDSEVFPLIGAFITAFNNKANEQLEGMIGTLRVQISRLATKEAYWVFGKDGDDFDLKISDPKSPSYLLIANDPEKQNIISALNAMILNRLVTRVNSGQGKNIPVSIIVDELPTLYFYGIDNLIATARSNKVCVLLGFQELPQLEAGYGKVNKDKIVSIIGNVISGSARNKETLEWLSNDIFGKVVQIKRGVTVDRDRTSVNINENMDNLVPASKISDMSTGWLCGQVARDFSPTATKSSLFRKKTVSFINFIFRMLHIKKRLKYDEAMNIQESEEFQTSKFFCKTDFDMKAIKAEEDDYKNYPLPMPYKFSSKHARERILYANYDRVEKEVNDMITEIVQQFKKD